MIRPRILRRFRSLALPSLCALILVGCGTPTPSTTLVGVVGSPTKAGTAAATENVASVNTTPTQKAAPTSTPLVQLLSLPTLLPGQLAVASNPATKTPTRPVTTPTPLADKPPTVTLQPTQVPPTTAATQAATSAATKVAQAPTTPAATVKAASGNKGNAANGKTLFNGVGTCNTCHDATSGIQIVGPSLKGVATRAATRKPGMAAEDYLRESLLKPNAFVVQGFPSGVMPQNFAQMLNSKQIDDIIAYLLTLK